jgi:hypothetical protein
LNGSILMVTVLHGSWERLIVVIIVLVYTIPAAAPHLYQFLYYSRPLGAVSESAIPRYNRKLLNPIIVSEEWYGWQRNTMKFDLCFERRWTREQTS